MQIRLARHQDRDAIWRILQPMIRIAHSLGRSLRGPSWAGQSLNHGRVLVEFQNLKKPQDAKRMNFREI